MVGAFVGAKQRATKLLGNTARKEQGHQRKNASLSMQRRLSLSEISQC